MKPVRRDLPTGTVTFLFTDIEGSTRLLHELGPEGYAAALAGHRRVLRDAFARHGGVEMGTEGDAFFVVFSAAPDAVQAAREGQEALRSGPIRVRMGMHTGTPHLTDEGYIGEVVHRAARIAAAGHGGQVLLSKETRDLVSVDATDLGEHRVKDFAEPVWIFQLGKERFPPLKTISNTNLPRPASSFVGRDREVQEVVALLNNGARLLTLTGPGGSGKTRLAIETAAEVVPDFKAGVFWVGLAPLRDPALVSSTISETLGAKDGLADHIGQREMLLLLDNLEQVIEAAPELAALVEDCPNLRLLVTSRELLRVRGEVEYPVLPLAEPEAVELFCARSRLEADESIARLCARLDNLPLAVELAAARTSVLSPAQILDRLARRLDLLKGGRDAEARQQTLRSTIEWSYDLLDVDEKRLFARLAVFTGGCTLESAEAVAQADVEILQSLIEKSLLRHENERFWMLETIREYAAERLEASGEAPELRSHHAEHFRALAEEAEPHLWASSREWFDRIEREHENLRAALGELEARGEAQLVLGMAAALSEFWDERGHQAEGRRRLENALRADDHPTAARAKALNGAAAVALSGGDAAAARRWAEEGLELHRRFRDRRGIADSALHLGGAVGNEGNLERAQHLLQESLELFEDLGDQHSTLVARRYLAWAVHGLGDLERERHLLEHNLHEARAIGNERMEGSTLGALAMAAAAEGHLDESLAMLADCHRIHRDHRDLVQMALNVSRFARVLTMARRAETAACLLSGAEAIRREMGASVPWVVKMDQETLATIHAQLDEAAFREAWERGLTLTADEAVALAVAALA
jgi:predicted ATPase/class 3 adenylate cyclase